MSEEEITNAPELEPEVPAAEPETPVEEVSTPEPEVPVEEPVAAPVEAPKTPEKPKYAEPKAVSIEDIENAKPAPAGPAVVSNKTVDDVLLASIVYKNLYSRKSLSVHHLQRRLTELGYTEAGKDKDGYYGDQTKSAVARFQAANKLEGEGLVDARTLLLLFTGDPNVNVVI